MSDCFGKLYDEKECEGCSAAFMCKVVYDNDLGDAPLEEKLFVMLSVGGRRSADFLAKVLNLDVEKVRKVLEGMKGVKKEVYYKLVKE